MDAKPQRPLRVFRATDENMAPVAIIPSKTLHQRTKSVPAFSTLRNGATRAMADNTNKKVLGEVNANAKLSQPAKDDSILGKKGSTLDAIKSSLLPLSRPALRPTQAKSVSIVAQAQFTTVKEPLSTYPVLEPTKTVVSKKSTKVLRDSDANFIPSVPVLSTAVALEADTSDLNLKSLPVLSSAEPILTATNNIHSQALQPSVETTAEICPPLPLSTTSRTQAVVKDFECLNNAVVYQEVQQDLIEPLSDSNVTLPKILEVMPAQHYSEELDAEYYDDDGYTTARSFGLRGESFGCVTTIFMPKQTEKVRLEIEHAKAWVDASRTEEEIDDEEWDTSMVAEYSEEIFEYMRQLEDRMRPDPRYMDKQTEIQWSMRAVLVDWVVQVHQRFNLLPETLFLAVNYIDRFLTHKVVSLGKLQLVGATALFIAAKFEEVNCPTLQEIIFMVDGGYTIDELLKAERFMLSMLQFDLGWPGPMSFLRRISKADDYDLETRTLAKYFLEITIMDERFVGCTPSFLAAGAHCMARLMLRKGDWTIAHVAYSQYTYAQLRQLLNGILDCCENPQKHHLSVYEKYTDKRYTYASTFVEKQMMQGFSLQPRTYLLSPAARTLELSRW